MPKSRHPAWLEALPFDGPLAIAASLDGKDALTCFFRRHRLDRLPFEGTWGGTGQGVSYLLAGSGSLVENQGSEQALVPGTVFQHGQGRQQRLRFDDGAEVYECSVYIPKRRADALRALGSIHDQELVHRAGPMRAIADAYLALYRALLAWPPSTAPRIAHLLGALLDIIDSGRQPSAGESDVERFRAAIDQRFDERLPLARLADELGLDYDEIRGPFRRLYGASPSDYRIHRRIEVAKGLLLEGNVQEAARRLGFPDAFAFSRQFRKRTGITPSQFRERKMPGMR